MRLTADGKVIDPPCDACGKFPAVPIGKTPEYDPDEYKKTGFIFIRSKIHICEDCANEALQQLRMTNNDRNPLA